MRIFRKIYLAIFLLICSFALHAASLPPGPSTSSSNNWTADQTFSGSAIFQGGTAFSGATRTNIFADGTSAGIDLIDHTFTPNQRRASFLLSGGTFEIVFLNDDVSAASQAMIIVGDSTGVSSITIGSGTGTATTVSGTLASQSLSVTGDVHATGNVSGLSGVMPLRIADGSGTLQTNVFSVHGTATLTAGTVQIDLNTATGGFFFTSTSSYICLANDTSGAAVAVSTKNVSNYQFNIFGIGTDTVSYICTGN